MKLLITGADGLLGGNLVRACIDAGHEVQVLVHPSSSARTLDGLPIRTFAGDVLVPESVDHAMRGCRAVVHAAASTALYPARSRRTEAVNVVGTRVVVDAAIRLGIGRFVHVGTASSFGYGTMETPGNETTPYRYARYGFSYFDSKRATQEWVLEQVGRNRIDAVVVNPTLMFGPYDSRPSSGRLFVGHWKRPHPFYPLGGRNVVDVRDVADAIVQALVRGRTGECYLLGNRNLTMRSFYRLMSEIIGVAPPRVPVPRTMMLAAGFLGSTAAKAAVYRDRPVPELTWAVARNGNRRTYYDCSKAQRELGLGQRPVYESFEAEWRWLVDNGYVDGWGVDDRSLAAATA